MDFQSNDYFIKLIILLSLLYIIVIIPDSAGGGSARRQDPLSCHLIQCFALRVEYSVLCPKYFVSCILCSVFRVCCLGCRVWC